LPERKIEEVEEIYNGRTVKKIRFILIDPIAVVIAVTIKRGVQCVTRKITAFENN
jgi:hypothetical protein